MNEFPEQPVAPPVVPAPQPVLPVPPLDSLAQLNYDYQPPSALKQPPVVNFMDQQFSSHRWVGYLNAMRRP
jgi:hypothetical protein